MGSYILCQTKKASVPYYIENISTNIYSLEELCYYLYHNLYLIDHTIINEELCDWLGEELELTKLAAKIRPFMGKFSAAEDILYPVFKEINYLAYEELKALNAQLNQMEVEAPAIRAKKKGDALLENRMYVNAIRVYRKLLEQEELENIRPGMTESIWHNLGCTYSYLFQMEKALECFQKAYECEKSENALYAYLMALKMTRTPVEYEMILEEQEVSEEMRQKVDDALSDFNERSVREISPEEVDGLLDGFIKEYHRSTGS